MTVPFGHSVTGRSTADVFTLCLLMRKLLIIFIAAFGRSCPNVSLQQVRDSIPLGNVGTELNA